MSKSDKTEKVTKTKKVKKEAPEGRSILSVNLDDLPLVSAAISGLDHDAELAGEVFGPTIRVGQTAALLAAISGAVRPGIKISIKTKYALRLRTYLSVRELPDCIDISLHRQ